MKSDEANRWISGRDKNNMFEYFNAWIIKARYMPVLTVLQEIHDQIMVKLHQKRDVMLKSKERICPRIKKKVDAVIIASAHCDPLWDGKISFQVKERDCDIMGPPPIPKKLRGRPQRLRMREGWEDKGNNGQVKRVSRVGRKMCCNICRKSNHRRNQCLVKEPNAEPTEQPTQEPTTQPTALPGVVIREGDHKNKVNISTPNKKVKKKVGCSNEKGKDKPRQTFMLMPTPRVMNTTDFPTNNTPPVSTPPNEAHLSGMGFQTPSLSSISSSNQTRGGEKGR